MNAMIMDMYANAARLRLRGPSRGKAFTPEG